MRIKSKLKHLLLNLPSATSFPLSCAGEWGLWSAHNAAFLLLLHGPSLPLLYMGPHHRVPSFPNSSHLGQSSSSTAPTWLYGAGSCSSTRPDRLSEDSLLHHGSLLGCRGLLLSAWSTSCPQPALTILAAGLLLSLHLLTSHQLLVCRFCTFFSIIIQKHNHRHSCPSSSQQWVPFGAVGPGSDLIWATCWDILTEDIHPCCSLLPIPFQKSPIQ